MATPTSNGLGYSFTIDSGTSYVDALLSGTHWGGGFSAGISMTYSIPGVGSFWEPGYSPDNEPGSLVPLDGVTVTALQAALASWAAVADIRFTQVADTQTVVGDIRVAYSGVVGGGGWAYLPGGTPAAGDVWLNPGAFTASDFAPGGSGLATLIHELGHALGLDHPGGVGTNPAYTSQHTVMSYNDHPHAWFREVTETSPGSYSLVSYPVQPETPMLYDIAAMQYLYGANTTYRTGDDTYTFDPQRPFFMTLWDAGGYDTISVANFTLGCVIDLRAGMFSSVRIPSDPLPPGVTSTLPATYDGTDNLAIAFGVTIEKAVGGGGRDRLIGNGAANTLLGGGGADTLIGNAGNDILNGGGGADSMSGGVGNDLYVVDNAGDVVTELADGGIDTLQSSVSRILGDQQENLTLLGTAAINATGNALNNVLQGNAGNNILDGGAGSDTASYAFATAPVNVSLALAGAQATGGAGTDTLIGIENLRGGSGADTVTGNAGANALFGGAGADTLRGGGGADRFVFDSRTGADLLLDFASGVDRLQISQAQIRVGDGDTLVEGGVVVAGPGGFAPGAELVILTGNISGAINATAAAARIGSAGAAYAPGQTGLFAVDNGVSSALFLFTAADANALVAATELRLLGSLSGTAATVLADYQFVA